MMETKPAPPAIDVAERTDPGRDPAKQVNEDACTSRETPLGHLSVLCDGMGGHENGREAATLAVRTIFESFDAARIAGAGGAGERGRRALAEAITRANRRVFDLGGASQHGRPGSTVVALLVHAGGAEIAHVGDSRAYVLQAGEIFQLTKDHSMVQKLVDAGALTPAQAAAHPDANQILRALGTAPEVEVEVRAQTLPLTAGDALVLCSDGLSDLVDAADILRVVTAASPADAVTQLVDLANARGGHDNITVVVARLREAAGGSASPGRSATRPGRGSVLPTIAQTVIEMPAVPMPSGAPAPRTSLPIRPLLSTAPDLGVPPSRRRPSIAVAIGVLLAFVGVGAAAFAVYLLLHPALRARQVAPFALSGVPMSSARKNVSLVPVGPDPDPAADAQANDAPVEPAPLPSLVPSPPLRPGRAR
jgi:protein phosphatase